MAVITITTSLFLLRRSTGNQSTKDVLPPWGVLEPLSKPRSNPLLYAAISRPRWCTQRIMSSLRSVNDSMCFPQQKHLCLTKEQGMHNLCASPMTSPHQIHFATPRVVHLLPHSSCLRPWVGTTTLPGNSSEADIN